LLLASSLAILFHAFTLTGPGNNFLCWLDNRIWKEDKWWKNTSLVWLYR
jgi:hypothetical protein